VGHQTAQTRPGARVTRELAESVAQTMQVLATASRVRILAQLLERPRTVAELTEAVAMEQSAVSQQLRLLRHLGLVVGRRQGRNVLYALHDQHIGRLLDEAIGHAEHLELGLSDAPPDPPSSSAADRGAQTARAARSRPLRRAVT
jgi:ArsR family transcriptional regulator, nickel/cobalt-responsive transcriptional repressor